MSTSKDNEKDTKFNVFYTEVSALLCFECLLKGQSFTFIFICLLLLT